jgi:hypothetical protein
VEKPPSGHQRKALSHLLSSRMAAAWNARSAASEAHAPTVVIADNWGNGQPRNLFGGKRYINANIIGGGIDPNPQGLSASNHGYHVTGIVFGSFANDATGAGLVTGVFPGRGRLVPIDGQNDGSLWADENKLAAAIDSIHGHVVLNTSLSDGPDASGSGAVSWIELVRQLGLENRVFHATAAGNDGLAGGTAGAASSWSAAATRPDLQDDTGAHVAPLTNTVAVENAEEASNSSALTCLNQQSNSGGSVAAPGTDVYSFDKAGHGINLSGTSQASPVVAGLAAYLWAIAPDLTPQDLVSAITQNPQPAPDQGCARPSAPRIDAYAATLSMDQAVSPKIAGYPVRMAILNVTGGRGFNGDDLETFARKVDPDRNPGARDWSRFDLNGDGFTGGSETAPFDLDRSDSTRAGATVLADATVTVAGTKVSYDENAVTDADVLCFYAYSPLYTGTSRRRHHQLKKLCTEVRAFSGTANGGRVTFRTKFVEGKTRLVLAPIRFANVPISCDQGQTTHTDVEHDDLDVSHNSFHDHAPAEHGQTAFEFTGHLNEEGTEASGTFRDHGDFHLPGINLTHCDSGVVHWSAQAAG